MVEAMPNVEKPKLDNLHTQIEDCVTRLDALNDEIREVRSNETRLINERSEVHKRLAALREQVTKDLDRAAAGV